MSTNRGEDMQSRNVNRATDADVPSEQGVPGGTWLMSEPPLECDLEIQELESEAEMVARIDHYGPLTRILVLIVASLLAWGLLILPVWLLADV